MIQLEEFYAVYTDGTSYKVPNNQRLFAIPRGDKIEIYELDTTGFFKPETSEGFVTFIHSKAFPSPAKLLDLKLAHEEQRKSESLS